MKCSRFVAALMACVMVMGLVQPALAWFGGDEVKKHTETFIKGAETIEGVIEVGVTGVRLYNAENNDERLDIAVDAGKRVAKGYVKHSIKAAADTAITTSATSTAVYLAGAAGMTAKTGTAIAALSGAAATNATLCAIGTPVVAATGIVAAPAVVGGVIVAGVAAGVCYGVHCLIDWIW